MIGKLRGIIDAVADDSCLVDVGGVGYVAFASSRTLRDLAPGREATLLIETIVREDAIALYGFLTLAERDWFRILTTVQGVGARVALSLLSTLAPEQLANAIVAQDRASLSRASGVGPKLAARLLTELKDKAAAWGAVPGAARVPATAAGPAESAASVNEDAVSALVNLGYKRPEAFGAIARVATRLGGDARIDTLIREGLRELGK
ncbi:Holliday junction branch migration protein RuvA [Reyranella sp. CPCC 100927]|uniref:Holliday junction branch migration protein RuvA n=1 Tax=Reyranella sp. CPCC 100927 TaxID=2599616 RepID=UPI0011B36CF2|nr:Holliday junction branch migration protein RuvA [Reyranella sp. CPCC 100927]TWT12691.1 Holliday junction branch migration protein RuvA [Reyranella sp. CPCC 100927]